MTTEPCQLAVIERDQFKAFLAADPEAAYALIVTLISRARNLTRAIGSLALLDVYGRVARLLLDSATEEDGTLIVGERMTQQEIANRVGASRETVSRIITDLREGGYIGMENNRFVVYRRLPETAGQEARGLRFARTCASNAAAKRSGAPASMRR